MDKIKRFIDLFVPVTTCTLRCHYCYITHKHLFGGPLPTFQYSPEHVRKALSLERLGGPCLINMCGEGETLLPTQVLDYVKELCAEGHYVMVVTNATVDKRFDEIATWPKELTSHLFFKFSYHYLEFKKKNMLDKFYNNVRKAREAGCSFTVEATPSDELIPYIDEMMQSCRENLGAVNHVTVARDERREGELPVLTNMSMEDYAKTWGVYDSSFFSYKMSIFGEKRKEFCYAGAWSLRINLATGDAQQCYCSFISQNVFEDLSKPIIFKPIGNNCQMLHCYNGHAFLVLGMIPELKAPTYGEIRNRQCDDGSEWLQPEMKSFMETKLFESNAEYTEEQKEKANKEIRRIIHKNSIKSMPSRIINKIKHIL